MKESGTGVLLAVSGPKTEKVFSDMIHDWQQSIPITVKTTCKEAWKSLQESTYSIVIVLSPLNDGEGYDLASMASQTSAGVIFVCRQEAYAGAVQKLESRGIYVFSTAMGRKVFEQALRMMHAVSIRLSKDVPQTQMLQERIKDIRIVNRAKCLLIQYERMSEEEAHKMIEKEAMNRRLSRREIAQEILDSYGA